MSRASFILATLLVLPACDDGAPTSTGPKEDNASSLDAAAAGKSSDAARDEKAGPPPLPPPPPPVDPWQAQLEARVLATSGLGVGGRLSAFEILNAQSGERYCQVCRFGADPKLMVVGTLDDPAFHEDLKNLDAIMHKYADSSIKAFAVLTEIDQGRAKTSPDADALREQAKSLAERLGIDMPIVVPAPDDDGTNRVWDQYYNITASRTVMLADGRNRVRFNTVAPSDWSDLDAEIQAILSPRAG